MGAHTGAHMDATGRAAQGAGDALGHGGSHHLDGGRLELLPFGHRNDCPPNARFIPGMPYNLKRQPAHSDFMALPLRIQNGSGSSIRWRRSSEGSGKNARKAGFRDKKAFGSEADRGTARGAEAGAGRVIDAFAPGLPGGGGTGEHLPAKHPGVGASRQLVRRRRRRAHCRQPQSRRLRRHQDGRQGRLHREGCAPVHRCVFGGIEHGHRAGQADRQPRPRAHRPGIREDHIDGAPMPPRRWT